jgi:hypothetical protein
MTDSAPEPGSPSPLACLPAGSCGDGKGGLGCEWAQFWAHSGIDEFRSERDALLQRKRKGLYGTPERIRTSDLLLRRRR